MRIALIFTTALLGIPTVTAEEPTIESLTRKIEVLEKSVANLGSQLALSRMEVKPGSGSRVKGELVLYVLKDGRIQVKGETTNDVEVSERLKAVAEQVPDHPVRIFGDPETKYQNIVRVVDLCQKSGIWNITLATTQPYADELNAAAPPLLALSRNDPRNFNP